MIYERIRVQFAALEYAALWNGLSIASYPTTQASVLCGVPHTSGKGHGK